MEYTFDIRVVESHLSHYLYFLYVANETGALVKSYEHNTITNDQKLICELLPSSEPIAITYKEKILKVAVKESSEIFTTSARPVKFYSLIITITSPDIKEAEKIIQSLYNDCIEYSKYHDVSYITVFTYAIQIGWTTLSRLVPRPLDTIYMETAEKTKLINDVTNFLQDEQEYIKFGIPYKRCYLLQGIPGSGKTSLICAIASMLKKDICMFTFSADMTDEDFVRSVACVDATRILVLEDIDSLFEQRESTNTSHVSFSCLLNVLDGMCRKNKLITFLTTNKMDSLDKALIRPGRVDYILAFTHAQKKQVEQMFQKFIPEQIHNFETFYGIIQPYKINIALLQKFLFEHRKATNILDHKKDLMKLLMQYEEKNAQLYT